METIRGLIIDDTPANIESLKGRFDPQFDRIGWRVIWETATEATEAQRLIRSAGVAFDFIIIDLLFVRTDLPHLHEPRGLELIREANRRSTHTFIFAISTGLDHLPDLLDEARRCGAHHAVRRVEFSAASIDHSPTAIAEEVCAHLQDNGTVVAAEVNADDLDPAIQGLLHEVGKPTLARLQRKILSENGHDTRHMYVRFLAPGASGASVCAVTSQIGEGRRTSHVLKLCRARDPLLREAERGRQAGEILPPNLLLQHRPPTPVGPINGWYALAGQLVERALTLRDWLAEGPPTPSVGDLLEALFVEGLGPIYADTKRFTEEPLKSFSFPYHRQRRVLHALSTLEEVIARPDGGRVTNGTPELVADLTAFVTEGRLPHILRRSVSQGTYTTYGHGDLHGGNVLVIAGLHPRPLLIDPSEFGQTHWATDPACLAVDLLMRGVDAGAESMFFAGFDTWRTLFSRFSDGESDLTAATSTLGTTATLAALSWIAVNLSRFCSIEGEASRDRHGWEWHAALATYLLRASYHTDLPPPKRALALVAAHDQLVEATVTIQHH